LFDGGGDLKAGERGEWGIRERVDGFSEYASSFVRTWGVDGREFAVEGCGNVFVLVVDLVVEEGDGGVWDWLFWLVKAFDCFPEFMLIGLVVEGGKMGEPFFAFIQVDGFVNFEIELGDEGVSGVSSAEDVTLGY
jgi:hypothetical protein